jgi:hypothetical protein
VVEIVPGLPWLVAPEEIAGTLPRSAIVPRMTPTLFNHGDVEIALLLVTMKTSNPFLFDDPSPSHHHLNEVPTTGDISPTRE